MEEGPLGCGGLIYCKVGWLIFHSESWDGDYSPLIVFIKLIDPVLSVGCDLIFFRPSPPVDFDQPS